MKKQKIILFEIIFLLCFIIVSIILNQNSNIKKEKKVIKEMTESEYDNSITELNKSHEDYARQVQENKKKLAQAISNENVATSENATVDEMVANIGKILEARTSDATATADNITEGKTAWVNGKLITGTGGDINIASGKDYKITIKYSARFLHKNSANDSVHNSHTVSSSYIIYLKKDGTYTTDGNNTATWGPKNGLGDIYFGCSATIDSITIEAI